MTIFFNLVVYADMSFSALNPYFLKFFGFLVLNNSMPKIASLQWKQRNETQKWEITAMKFHLLSSIRIDQMRKSLEFCIEQIMRQSIQSLFGTHSNCSLYIHLTAFFTRPFGVHSDRRKKETETLCCTCNSLGSKPQTNFFLLYVRTKSQTRILKTRK